MHELSHELNRTGRSIIDSAFAVHTELGPGLLESIYEQCLIAELSDRGLSCRRQAAVPVIYKGRRLDAGLRLDLIVEEQVIVEIKAVEKLLPVHEAQVLTYLKLADLELGYLINFNVRLIKDGIRRLVRTQ